MDMFRGENRFLHALIFPFHQILPGPGKTSQWLFLSVLHCPVLKPCISLLLLLFNYTRLLESCQQNTSKKQGKMDVVSMSPGGQLRKMSGCGRNQWETILKWRLEITPVYCISDSFSFNNTCRDPCNCAVGCFYPLWQKPLTASPAMIKQIPVHLSCSSTFLRSRQLRNPTTGSEILWKLFVSKQFPGYFITHYKFANCSWMIKY